MESETADKILKQVFELFMNAIKVDYNYSIDFTFKKKCGCSIFKPSFVQETW